MKLRILLFLTFFSSFSVATIAQSKHAGVQKFINTQGLEHASVGICVKNISGEKVISHNAQISYTPASILKVVTTATAIEMLGENYRYQTTLAKDNNKSNRLLIHGYGDPTLGTEYLNNTPNAFLSFWTSQIKQNFKSDTPIEITVLDDYFGYEGISQRWIYQDLGNYYASGTYGISIYDNTYRLYFNTMRQDTCPIILKSEPKVNISFQNTLKMNTTGQDNAYIHGLPFSTNRTLTGDIPSGRSSFSIKGDIPNPGLYLGEVLAEYLKNEGFSIEKVENNYDTYHNEMYSKNKRSLNENIFYTHHSFPLKDIIKDTNVRSNNHYAEHLLRTIGRTRNTYIYSSALDEGVEAVNAFWKDKGIDTNALFMFDGSGLSPANAVSPEFMCDLLVYMQAKSKNAKTFLESLPEAGKNGTVGSRLKGSRLTGKIFMKSGSINGVQCFAGYYVDGEKKYAFTVMVNKFTGPRAQVVRAIDNLLLSLF